MSLRAFYRFGRLRDDMLRDARGHDVGDGTHARRTHQHAVGPAWTVRQLIALVVDHVGVNLDIAHRSTERKFAEIADRHVRISKEKDGRVAEALVNIGAKYNGVLDHRNQLLRGFIAYGRHTDECDPESVNYDDEKAEWKCSCGFLEMRQELGVEV